ncbi:uncharacterized protein TNCV_517821 [Trichonephila clavipes]|nr:uncharacterized protein TNCV_517821 [Trichonephila clavipes]
MPNATCRKSCAWWQSLTFRGCLMLFFSSIMPAHTLLASPNLFYEVYRCFRGQRNLLISHQSNTCGMSLDAVCKLCPCLVRTTHFGKWLKGNGEPSLRTPSALLLTLYLDVFLRASRWFYILLNRCRAHCVT